MIKVKSKTGPYKKLSVNCVVCNRELVSIKGVLSYHENDETNNKYFCLHCDSEAKSKKLELLGIGRDSDSVHKLVLYDKDDDRRHSNNGAHLFHYEYRLEGDLDWLMDQLIKIKHGVQL